MDSKKINKNFGILIICITCFLLFKAQLVFSSSCQSFEKFDDKIETWNAAIDSIWGPGLPTVQKLEVFDKFWTTIDHKFACFQNLDVNWDSLKAVYRPEISAGVSRGRFAAIMNHLALALKESHTYADNKFVNWKKKPAPGIPLMVVGGWGDSGHFGAGVTPLADSTLLIYKTVPSHPLGIKPGDIILGFDGLYWKDIYPKLIDAQLPLYGRWWGSSPSAYLHSWLMSGGLNWHLFDVIDIIQYTTGDTLHLPTSLLQNQDMELFCSDQLEIPGIHMKNMEDFRTGKVVSYGKVAGTDIGYIYVWGWYSDVEEQFYRAVLSFLHKSNSSGLIIDLRANFGGNMFLSNDGLELLFNKRVTSVGFAARSDSSDHLAFEQVAEPEIYIIDGKGSSFYDRPIAVLTGPGARSSGDLVALRLKYHPMTRFFGKSTTSSFNSPITVDLGNNAFVAAFAEANAFLATNPDHLLTRDEFKVDEEIWLLPKDVAKGKDTVVEAALKWIEKNNTAVIESKDKVALENFRLYQNYPNPFNHSTIIQFLLKFKSDVEIEICDVQGRRVANFNEIKMSAGEHTMQFNANALSSGTYFYTIKVNGFVQTKRMTFIK